MATLTLQGRKALARLMQQQAIYLAWGNGASSWDNTLPPTPTNTTQLTNLIGYRKAKQIRFCEPDEQGEIQVPTGKFRLSDTASQHLYCQFTYDFEDGLGEHIRELGLMLGTTPKTGIPAGKYYLLPDEVVEAGELILLEHRTALFRDQGVRETFEFVISF
ncbi:hypothetical protein EXT48_12045 [Pseudoalteromonas sp. CO348]|uniref:hypothetical protein n=1 Tax=Pseudoalteromonas TaxID=53246 RepID=UPI001022F65A|nr:MULTISPECIES: hypothetical protein [Pseudoalteromonas]MCG9767899.1 hypothetical protein [Pseudoalteromonas piscicida]QZO13883.1 hypothetical protein K5642_05055 [Pseudoalteromonas piscicida]RZG04593.1 hypothetical protein EXT48_12045 [Pseudoalteromonas sp. CO348]